ncbi:hypothetical protein MSG28_009895 [Choristoneura fumiferana]|uniref:Uncharacterized protein n=1 Tax=Choristoneura fumiferana TaxID=7141 RepID=A0ACC0JD18_CHOFU|nr:hypothetical protein MSG28_009895 [Choristoneura fumiferana]
MRPLGRRRGKSAVLAGDSGVRPRGGAGRRVRPGHRCSARCCSHRPVTGSLLSSPNGNTSNLEPEAAAEGVEASEHDKRAILFDTSAGYRSLPEYEYKYRHGYPSFYRYEYHPSVRLRPTLLKLPLLYLPLQMNKLFVLALFALVAACSAAPPETPAYLEPEAAAEGVEASEHDKRAILFATSAGYRYLPEYEYKYRNGYPSFYRYEYPSVPAQTYPYSSYPYSTYPYRDVSFSTVDVAADDDDGTRAEPGRIMNKFFVLALFALVAACSAAPPETPAYLEPEAAAEGVEASEHDKRAILFATSAGYRYLPEYEYKYRSGYPSYYRYEYPSVPAQAYPYSTYRPYSTYPYSIGYIYTGLAEQKLQQLNLLSPESIYEYEYTVASPSLWRSKGRPLFSSGRLPADDDDDDEYLHSVSRAVLLTKIYTVWP